MHDQTNYKVHASIGIITISVGEESDGSDVSEGDGRVVFVGRNRRQLRN